MQSKSKFNVSSLPKQWLFFNPATISKNNYFYRITNKNGVVFFYDENNVDMFLQKIKPYINWCQQKRIKFIIPFSFIFAYMSSAFGVLLDSKCKKQNNNRNVKKLKEKFFIVSKIHNLKEAIVAKNAADIIFISPVFRTLSFPEKKPLSNHNFISLCFSFEKKVIFALGGVNKKKFAYIRNTNLYGFGSISSFKEKDE